KGDGVPAQLADTAQIVCSAWPKGCDGRAPTLAPLVNGLHQIGLDASRRVNRRCDLTGARRSREPTQLPAPAGRSRTFPFIIPQNFTGLCRLAVRLTAVRSVRLISSAPR